MDPVRAAGDRDVEPIVDHDARRRPSNRVEHRGDERRQRRGLEVALAHLNEIDARVGGVTGLRQETAARLTLGRARRDQTAAVGDEAERHESDGSAASEERATKISARSAKPAHRLTNPSPLTAPRT